MLISSILLCSIAWTADPSSEKIPVKEGYEVMDMNQFKDLESPTQKKQPIKISSSCKSKVGIDIKSNEIGYESCLRESSDRRTSPTITITPEHK